MRKHDPAITMDAKTLLEREAQEWLVLLTSGRATAADAEAFKRWCERSRSHAEAFAEANLLWENLAAVAQRVHNTRALAHANSNRVAAGRRAFLAGAGATAAAAIGYLVVRPPFDLWPSARELNADYRTSTGERRRIAMENGVSIDLNTRTSLNLRRKADEEQLELVSGEATVATVQKLATPLTITAGGGRIQVSDASFNLRCDGAGAVVTCGRGSVAIEYLANVVVLQKDQQIAYGNGTWEAATVVDPTVVMAWREGQLIFRQTPLFQVIAEVNRYRPGRIVLTNEALGRRLVEARVPLDRMDDLIVLVREAYGAHVTTLPGGIVVLS